MAMRMLEAAWSWVARLAAIAPASLSWSNRHLLAVALTLLALAVRMAIAPQDAGLPYVTFFPAATLAAVFGGIGPGLLSTALGAVLAVTLFFPPFGTLTLESEALLSAAVFCADEVLVCSAIEAMRRHQRDHAASLVELRQAKAEAEKANAAKSRFLAAASHDLRQPYQALRLYHAVLEGRDNDPLQAKVLAQMDMAMKAGEDMLQSLLDVSALDAGTLIPRTQPLAVPAILAAAEARHRPVAEAKGLRFRVRALPGTLEADPVLLARILDNLLSNAIRYTARGTVLLAFRLRGGAPCIEVRDTGIGIAPEHHDAVFEEFFQVANRERDRAKGTGLGLTVVSKTARLLGYRLALRSFPGRGTCVRLLLPPGTYSPAGTGGRASIPSGTAADSASSRRGGAVPRLSSPT